jgi:hypothetical protein
VLFCIAQAMGQLLLQLACAVGGLPSPSLDFAHAHYSPEFVRLLLLLLGVAEGGAFSWRAVSAILGERLLLDMDTLAIFNEQLVGGVLEDQQLGGCACGWCTASAPAAGSTVMGSALLQC